MKKFFTAVAVCGLVAITAQSVQAVNLLTNGNFELGASGPDFPGWSSFETVPSQPGAVINNLEQPTFGGPAVDTGTGQRLAWLRPFTGNQGIFMDQNVQNNAGLSQTVAGQVGESYTFTGWSKFEENYSGGLDTVDGNPSPTTTTWNLDFLNSSGSVIGGATPYDVRANRESQSFLGFANDNTWYEHTLMATAPAGTASVRVMAGGYNMIANNTNTANQSAMFDYFSLRGAAAPGTELLTNADLNTGAITPPPLPNWTVVADPATAGDQGGDFSDNPNTPGVVGYWIRAFLGAPGNSTLSQRVAANPGDTFDFSGWAAFGQNYSGGTSGTHPATTTLLEVAFLDAAEQEISVTPLDLWDAGLRNATGGITATPQAWQQFFINGQVAPANTAFVEVRVDVTGAMTTMNPDQGAFFDDFVLQLASATLAGDYNSDGKVDAADYVSWRKGNSPNPNSVADYNTWRSNFGNPPGSGAAAGLGAGSPVPEPAGCVLMLIALSCGAGMSRRLPSAG